MLTKCLGKVNFGKFGKVNLRKFGHKKIHHFEVVDCLKEKDLVS
jgi:hypothetical protein